MTDLSFGLTMAILGMGGTLLTLYILIMVIRLLARLFPFKEEKEESKN